MTTYLSWYEPSKKVPITRIIADASRRYERKHGIAPTVALVHPSQACAVDGVEVRADRMVAVNTVYVGEEEEG